MTEGNLFNKIEVALIEYPSITQLSPSLNTINNQVTNLELTKDIYEDASIKHWLAINGGNEMCNFLKYTCTYRMCDNLSEPSAVATIRRFEALQRGGGRWERMIYIKKIDARKNR